MNSLNDFRYRFATTTDKAASMLPPTEDAFRQHALRARYQTRIWCESHIAIPEGLDPVNHGWWSCEGGGVTPTKYTKESAPVELRDLTHLYCTDNDCKDEKNCPCLQAGLDCIEKCVCCESGCDNPHNVADDDNETVTQMND